MSDNNTKKRDRGANFNPEEKTLLANIVSAYKHIVEDKRTGGIFIKKKRETWEAIAQRYNSNCTSGPRKVEQLKTLYDNMKQNARKNTGESNVQTHKSDGESWHPTSVDCDIKVPADIQAQVDPLSNPYDSEVKYFKGSDNLNRLDQQSVDLEPSNLPTLKKKKGPMKRKKTEPMKNVKKYSSADMYKRLYFKRKYENANLERRKLRMEMLYLRQKHQLQMKLLEKKETCCNTMYKVKEEHDC